MNSSTRPDWAALAASLVLAILLGGIQGRSVASGRPDAVTSVVQRVLGGASSGISDSTRSVSDWWRGVTSAGALSSEIRRLRALEQSARLYDATSEQLERELEAGRLLVEAPGRGRKKFAAKIIGFYPSENRFTLSLAAEGQAKPGAAVVTHEGIVGVVQTVLGRTCQAILVTSPDCKFGAMVVGKAGRYPGLVRGDSPTRLVLDVIDLGKFEAGDIVLTTGYSPVMPRGLMVGTVVEVIHDPNFGTQRAFVAPSAGLEDVAEVWVLE